MVRWLECGRPCGQKYIFAYRGLLTWCFCQPSALLRRSFHRNTLGLLALFVGFGRAACISLLFAAVFSWVLRPIYGWMDTALYCMLLCFAAACFDVRSRLAIAAVPTSTLDIRRECMTLPLRPHHGMCIRGFVGKGYDDAFAPHCG